MLSVLFLSSRSARTGAEDDCSWSNKKASTAAVASERDPRSSLSIAESYAARKRLAASIHSHEMPAKITARTTSVAVAAARFLRASFAVAKRGPPEKAFARKVVGKAAQIARHSREPFEK